ncbi:hypothetical protein PHMEG_00037428 [Phytophthora megakarya]|uniref:Crinkler effector protein N-terminal domain-containing protein n=1 Tax=Phytophthora megakarya TaxID=4795 RepID=A0A225UJT5_9STRA|nr:hypothetical protein PHMEG_00037428 [Phytophthora megakarya]
MVLLFCASFSHTGKLFAVDTKGSSTVGELGEVVAGVITKKLGKFVDSDDIGLFPTKTESGKLLELEEVQDLVSTIKNGERPDQLNQYMEKEWTMNSQNSLVKSTDRAIHVLVVVRGKFLEDEVEDRRKIISGPRILDQENLAFRLMG